MNQPRPSNPTSNTPPPRAGSDNTSPSASDDTSLPASNDTSPSASNDTSLPASNDTSPSASNDTSPSASNDNAYIHEFIDIRGTHRADYMQHMAANWSPSAQEDRHQLLFGMWAVLGTTGPWPQVCNIWEEPGLDGLARSFANEATGPGLQDAKLERWWNKASEFRRGGFDRILLPAPWMPSITHSIGSGVHAEVFAHEIIRCRPGSSPDLLELARELAVPAYEPHGWHLVGAWTTAMRDDDEAILLWALDDWQAWAEAEKVQRSDSSLLAWRERARASATDWHRILLAAAPLCPFRTGRQPTRSDQVDWQG